MQSLRRQILRALGKEQDALFLGLLHGFEKLVSKVLALCLVILIMVAVFDLFRILYLELRSNTFGFFGKTLIEMFGLFLNILIALEIMENITVYLKKNVIQVELVIITAIIAVARKIIIFDFSKYEPLYLIALGFVGICLGVALWMVKQVNNKP